MMHNYIFQDWKVNCDNTKGKIFSFFFRLANLSIKSILFYYILFPIRAFYKFFFELMLGIEIPYDTKIGQGISVYHYQSIIINKRVIIGDNCILRQSTTIGNKTTNGPCPVLGNNVNIGANVCIIGNVIVGDNVVIGAGSVVVKSIPSNSVVVGNPARIIKTKK